MNIHSLRVSQWIMEDMHTQGSLFYRGYNGEGCPEFDICTWRVEGGGLLSQPLSASLIPTHLLRPVFFEINI